MELALRIEAESGTPLHQQIYDQLRDAILGGKLRSQQRLPASRYLAQTLGVSRTTVVQSYDQLISEGYLETRRGSGTFVCSQIPDDLLEAYRSLSGCLSSSVKCKSATESSGIRLSEHRLSDYRLSEHRLSDYRLSDYGDRVVQTPDRVHTDQTQLSFTYGVPALDLFPIKLWRQLWNRRAQRSMDWMQYAADPMGYAPLREQIADYIAQIRAVRCSPEQILITNGTQQALGLIVRLLIDCAGNRRDGIAIENPGYLSAKRIFASSGAALHAIPVDEEGIVVDGPNGLKARSAHHPIKLVYVTPSHQFPTGVLMPLSRRLALLQWAKESQAIIVEDDYDSEFRYSGKPTPALQGLDSGGQVLYVGTFSKVMFPGLRLGYIVLPPTLVDIFQRAKWLSDRQCSHLDQQALSDFIADGHMAKHIRRMRSLYAARRRALTQSLQTAFADGQTSTGTVDILGDEAGLHIMAKLPLQQSDEQVIAKAKAEGVTLFSAQEQYWHSEKETALNITTARQTVLGQGAFIFGFGNISETNIREAVDRLRPILR